ncbi:MAG TPA: NADH-quinone oxidoreductase subunit I [Holophaga sp.]|nr:NADH-quinone oxidoreductase subunit I [Holophaga sp.]HPS66294.1 NADH-quinone oxidoreductase subunit I [Holophaga sp.]
MAVVTRQVELNWLDRTYLWPVLKGMVITIRHFFRQLGTPSRKRFTLQYPDMKREMPAGYRGLHELKRSEDGAVKCVACFMCAEACPARCITIEAEEFSDLALTQGFEEKRPRIFQIDMLRCIYCGFCEEACPKDAIWLRKDYELGAFDRQDLRFGKWDLMNTYARQDGKPEIISDPKPAVPHVPVGVQEGPCS